MEDAIAKREIQAVLKRLYRYYDGRAKSCARTSKDNPEARNSIEHIIATKTWIAKSEAIRKVAENLAIALEEEA